MNSAGKGEMSSSTNLKVPGQTHRSLFKKTPKGKFTTFLVLCLMYANYDWICISEILHQHFFLLALHLLQYIILLNFYGWVLFLFKI